MEKHEVDEIVTRLEVIYSICSRTIGNDMTNRLFTTYSGWGIIELVDTELFEEVST
jgi:hypothetical protein